MAELEKVNDEYRSIEAPSEGLFKDNGSRFISLRILPLFAILIIFGALIWIGDDIIGFIQSLEFCLRLRIVRMQVGMELLCAFTISSSDILLRDILIHTENLIIIYKCHNYNSSIFKVFSNYPTKSMPYSFLFCNFASKWEIFMWTDRNDDPSVRNSDIPIH